MVTDYEHGGYNLDDNEIGTFITIIGVMQLLYQVSHYRVLNNMLYVKFLAYFVSTTG